MTPPQPFNPTTFLMLNKTRLFTAQDVCEIVDHYCTYSNATERDKILKQLLEWFENYCEGNEDPDLWMAYLHAERAFRKDQK